METLGSLLDKYSIIKMKYNTKVREGDEELAKEIGKQIDNLKSEIDSYLTLAIRGQVPLEEPKFKMYKGEDPSGEKFGSFAPVMDRLFEANWTLWQLEDKRREKDRSDFEIRKICDDVAKFNRIRNDCMDEINKILSTLISEKT